MKKIKIITSLFMILFVILNILLFFIPAENSYIFTSKPNYSNIYRIPVFYK